MTIVSFSDIEIARTVIEWTEWFNDVHAKIMLSEEVTKHARLKKGLYKQLEDEVKTLVEFLENVPYPNGFKFKPVVGNQGFDALVFDETGKQVHQLEFCFPGYSKEIANEMKELNENGCSNVKVFSTGAGSSEVFELRARTIRTLEDKAQKDYSGCTLVVKLALPSDLANSGGLLNNQVMELVEDARKIRHSASKVYILVSHNYCIEI